MDSLRERIGRAINAAEGCVAPERFPCDICEKQDGCLKVADAALAVIEPLLEAMRRHIRSYEPGTLVGSELNVAHHLRDLDGDVWAPWCVPGDPTANRAAELADLVEMVEASGTHVVVPVEPTLEMIYAGHPHCRRAPQYSLDAAEKGYKAMLAARPRDVTPTDKSDG